MLYTDTTRAPFMPRNMHVRVCAHMKPQVLTSYSGCAVQLVIIFNTNITCQITAIHRFEDFVNLWLASNQDAVCQGTQNAKVSPISLVNMYLRLLGATAINVVGLAIVTTTIPVFLCTSETYMDFVLNAAATIFIVQLDDLTNDTTIALENQEEMNSLIVVTEDGQGESDSLTQRRMTDYYNKLGEEEGE